ncbi:MAG: fluoride efflux transporter FluC [Aeromicrobium sp.]
MILVALAGGLGAALRLVTDGVVRSVAGSRLPWGTLVVNVLGSTALGALLGGGADGQTATVVGTGLLGGFTTFSTASFESAALALEQRRSAAFGYAAGTLVLSVAAAALGYFLAASTAF